MAITKTVICDCGCGKELAGKVSIFIDMSGEKSTGVSIKVDGAIINVDLDICEDELKFLANRYGGDAGRITKALEKREKFKAGLA